MIRYLTHALFVMIAIAGLALAVDVGAHRLGVRHAQAQPTPFDAGVTTVAAPDTGSGSGSAATSAATVSAHDPIESPQAALTDAEAAKKHGWPMLIMVSMIMLAKSLQTAGKRWPDTKWLAWLNTGFRAALITGVITVGTASCDALVNGGSWFAVAFAAVGSGLLLVHPAPSTKPSVA